MAKNIQIIEFWEKFKKIITRKNTVIFLAIILIGAFLRLHNFSDLLRFNADQVRDAQIVDNMQNGEEFPLLGPKAGGTKFKLGGAFYYLEYLSGTIFGFSPWGIAIFIPILSILSIGLFFSLFKKIFSIHLSLILTFFYAISFYGIKYSRFAWNPNAIPFFVFAFILLLLAFLNKKATKYTPILLGITMGLAMQLHTTLLILMPLIFLATFIFIYFRDKKNNFKFFSIVVALIVLLNIPFIYSDITNKGANIKEFISGTQTKTSSKSSLVKNIATDSQFFLQGSAYSLLGIEPQKNWTRVTKFLKSKDLAEYTLCFSSVLFFILGILLVQSKIRKEADKNKQNIFIFLTAFSVLSFVLFIPIGDELNLRFFIILLFLPYLMLGLIFQYLLTKLSPFMTKLILTLFVLIIAISNLNIYSKTYNLDNHILPDSVYGGVSYGELQEICTTMQSSIRQLSADPKNIFLGDFDFKRSLIYVCDKQNISLKALPKTNIANGSMVFVITKKESSEKTIAEYKNKFNIFSTTTIKRFTLITFAAK